MSAHELADWQRRSADWDVALAALEHALERKRAAIAARVDAEGDPDWHVRDEIASAYAAACGAVEAAEERMRELDPFWKRMEI